MMTIDHETLKTLHACSEKEAYESLNTSEKGLTQKEASQRQAQLGKNIINEAKKRTIDPSFHQKFYRAHGHPLMGSRSHCHLFP